ncbi:MAG: citramalate synthase [Armatimonadota bacterium]
MPKIAIYDTTLRDGMQGEGINFSAEEKLKVAKRLDDFGVAYIEGGWPGSNPKDIEFFEIAKGVEFKNAKLAAFGRTRHPKSAAENDPLLLDLLKAETPVVTIFGKSWDLHVTDVFRVTLDKNLAMIYDTVKFLVDNGREVIFDAEHFFDGYKNDSGYALQTLETAESAGASCLVLCETNGGALPSEVADVMDVVKARLTTPIGIHSHNDCDLAVANSIAAVQHGAVHVQGTINGMGERCGNANLVTIMPIIELKLGMKCVPDGMIRKLTELSRSIDEIANRVPEDCQPFVGASAFAHKAGVHVDAMMKNPLTYEHIQPESVGNRRRLLVSEYAGKSTIVEKAQQYDVDLTRQSPEVKSILNKVMKLEHEGYSFEEAEGSFELLLKKSLGMYRKLFDLKGFRVIIEKHGPNDEVITEATLKVAVDGEEAFTVAEGDGPVHALDNALRQALSQFYGEELAKIKLTDFKVRVINTKAATAAKVRTIIETRDSNEVWNTAGVSENIIEASWQALADGVEYGLLKHVQDK